MAVGPYAWSLTAADNDDADANINWAEGQTPASINNSARAVMAAARGWINGALGGIGTNGGSSNAYTYTNPTTATWASLADGNRVCIEANHTNNGAATLAVDGLTAKAIRKGATTALDSGDIVSGARYDLVYDAGNDVFQMLGGVVGNLQPLDATLTALAALSWSSLTPVIQVTAADTVSLTSAPKVTTLEIGDATDTTLGRASAGVLSVEGKSVAMMTQASQSWTQPNTITNAGALGWIHAEDTYARFGSGSNKKLWMGAVGGTYNWHVYAAGDTFESSPLSVALATLAWEWTGTMRARVPVSAETTGTLTAVSANKKVVCTGNITLDDDVFAANDFTLFDPGTSARTFTRSAGLAMYVNGTDSASATLAANQMGTAHWRDTDTVILTGAFS